MLVASSVAAAARVPTTSTAAPAASMLLSSILLVGSFPPHPLSNVLSLLFGLLNLCLEVAYLLLEPASLIRDVIHLPLYKEPFIPHHDLLVHEQAPCRRIQSEIKVVIVAVAHLEAVFHAHVVVLINSDLQLLLVSHLDF